MKFYILMTYEQRPDGTAIISYKREIHIFLECAIREAAKTPHTSVIVMEQVNTYLPYEVKNQFDIFAHEGRYEEDKP